MSYYPKPYEWAHVNIVSGPDQMVQYDMCLTIGCGNRIQHNATFTPSHLCKGCQAQFGKQKVSQNPLYQRARAEGVLQSVPSSMQLDLFKRWCSEYCQFCGHDLQGRGNLNDAFTLSIATEAVTLMNFYGFICKPCTSSAWSYRQTMHIMPMEVIDLEVAARTYRVDRITMGRLLRNMNDHRPWPGGLTKNNLVAPLEKDA